MISYHLILIGAAMTDDALSAPACRAARGLLEWSVRDLCAAAGVSPNTVGRLEAGSGIGPEPTARISGAFTAHGVELLGDDRPGARVSDPERFAQAVATKRS